MVRLAVEVAENLPADVVANKTKAGHFAVLLDGASVKTRKVQPQR